MKKIIFHILPLIFILLTIKGNGQHTYDWLAQPVKHTVKAENVNQSAVILEDERIHEFRKDEKNEVWLHLYSRRVIKLNDDKGVEMYNKVYIYIPFNSEVLEIKARSLQPNGKVVNLPADKIFDVEEEGKNYKKFAVEALEKGSELEYVVRFKKEVTTFGLEVFQSSSPIEKAKFTLIVPDYLIFTVKGYNGFKVSPESKVDDKRIIIATDEDIDALDEDKYASATPYHKNVQYKLSYNIDRDKSVRLNTWNDLAKNIYNNYYTLNDKELKSVDNFYRQMKLSGILSEEGKIIAIEEYLKTNINTDENAIGEDADKIERIIKTKVSGNFGFTRLFIGVLQIAGINNQIVFPSKRNDIGIDEEFENFRLVDDMLIYFPGTGNFLDPINAAYRYPHVQPYYAGTKGLFLKGTTIGDFKTALASFDSIPLQPYETNMNNLNVEIRFNDSMDSVLLHSKQSLSGYSAALYRPAYSFLPKDKQEEFTKDIIKAVGKSDKITNIKVENTALTDGSKNLPLNIIGDIVTAELTEKAGNKILLKIGEIIGPQEQMYQEKKRQLPILMEYPHMLDRVLKLTIPKGYRIKNLSDLNMNITDRNIIGVETMGFVSSYKQNDSELMINLHEFYKVTEYPISKLDEFRKVINAAADFNKVVLILEKI